MRSRRRSKGFTLVEILIVVVILGILAAIVVPQFASATADAQAGNIKAQIKSVQNQIELYKARNNQYPPLATLFADLVAGGYIKAPPVNPACPGTTAQRQSCAAAAGANVAWVYVAATGDFSAGYFDETNGVITPDTP